ncbi:MAG TPA: hypothetical protein PKJ63_11420 [Cyclobacteriaceae bacterium]|nr:hypothetical protein [Cyclobacteriaceae bacterium]
MTRLLLSITFFVFSILTTWGQHDAHRAKDLLKSLDGNFKWQIVKPSENKIIREGFRQSSLKMDSLILEIEETFNNSNVQMTGLLGYNASTKKYFSINCYNVDMGPHILYGEVENENVIEFEDREEVSALQVISPDKHEWTYRILVNDEWVPRDLKITFTRIP